MFLKRLVRRKSGKKHTYWALVESIRTCEIVAPASGVLISLPYDEGDTVTLEAVLAKIQMNR